MKKHLAIILSAVLALVAISPAFCAGGPEKASSGVTTVTLWHSATGSNGTAFDNLVDDFNSTIGKEKGIEIEAVYQGKASDVLTKVNAAMGTDTMPDIAMMDATAATDMNSSEELVTVDLLGVDVSDVMKCALVSYTSERGLLAVPFNASALLYYYNKTVYDQAGATAPKTLDDMAEVAKATAAEGRTAFSGVPATFELSTFIGAQNGLSYLLDNRNGHDGGATKALFDEEGTYKTFLEKWKAVYDTGCMNPITSGVTGEFTSGRTAAMLASSSNLASVISQVAGLFEVGVAKVPMVNENATGGTVISGGAMFAFTESEAVKTVLEYMISPEAQIAWSRSTGYVPVTTAAQQSAEYQAFLSRNPLYDVALQSLLDSNEGLANVWVPSAYSIYYSFQANIVEVLNGKDIDSAVSDMAAIVNTAIANHASQN